MDGPFAGEHQTLAPRPSANPTTGAAANMTLAFWNYKYYITADVIMICAGVYSVLAAA